MKMPLLPHGACEEQETFFFRQEKEQVLRGMGNWFKADRMVRYKFTAMKNASTLSQEVLKVCYRWRYKLRFEKETKHGNLFFIY